MSLKNKFQLVRQKIGRNSTYDWYTALLCFASCLVILLAIHIWIFIDLTLTSGTNQNTADKKSVSINQGDIQKAVQNIRERDANSKNVSRVVRTDPSL
ncbi:MAG: hypothetical protein RLZZ67_245 [Candidatus Parcubacteria bacterium]|jgi:cell division protein YceG involved in septum cleavage